MDNVVSIDTSGNLFFRVQPVDFDFFFQAAQIRVAGDQGGFAFAGQGGGEGVGQADFVAGLEMGELVFWLALILGFSRPPTPGLLGLWRIFEEKETKWRCRILRMGGGEVVWRGCKAMGVRIENSIWAAAQRGPTSRRARGARFETGTIKDGRRVAARTGLVSKLGTEPGRLCHFLFTLFAKGAISVK
jgi:hypothetical protein